MQIHNPPVIVLAFSGTGLATIRCLARHRLSIYAVLFDFGSSALETKYSRLCKTVSLSFLPNEEDRLYEWLISFAASFVVRPVVIPTSDGTALFLAKYKEKLSDHVKTWGTSYEDLRAIISKDGMYAGAIKQGLNVPPMLVEPTFDQVIEWSNTIAPPYLMKPFYVNIANCSLQQKNKIFSSSKELLEYCKASDLSNIIIQRMIPSGDGNVFDAYGICNKDGKVVALASHLRIRQYPPNVGATSYGVIPAMEDSALEKEIFQGTLLLMRSFKFHGIFGIEWLREKDTGKLYVIDFNARPFSSIGHLADCGLNLPLLSYQELVTQKDPEVMQYPKLKHKYWMDFNNDIRGFRETKKTVGLNWLTFARDLIRCRTFAYFKVLDPGPVLCRAYLFIKVVGEFIRKT